MFVHKSIATFLGIGYIKKGAGTIASLIFCFIVFCISDLYSDWYLLSLALLLLPAGAYVSFTVEKEWGKDSNRIVIDEIAGMAVSLLFIPLTPLNLARAFVLFRFFDIVKPLFIRRTENIPRGWGVMLDDIVAGIYANLLLQLYIHTIAPHL